MDEWMVTGGTTREKQQQRTSNRKATRERAFGEEGKYRAGRHKEQNTNDVTRNTAKAARGE